MTAEALREQPENQSITRELCDLGWSLNLSVLDFFPCNNSTCLMGLLATKPEKMCLCSRDGAGLASRNRTLRSCYLNTGLSLSHPAGRRGQTQLFPPASVLSRLGFHNPHGKGSRALGRPGLGRKAPPSRHLLPPHWLRPGHAAAPEDGWGSGFLAPQSPWRERRQCLEIGVEWLAEGAGRKEGHLGTGQSGLCSQVCWAVQGSG